jgi:hypothetical protein
MAGEASKSGPARIGILVLALIGVFYGMYMLGQAIASESEATQTKLDGLILQVEALSREVRSQRTQQAAAEAAPPAAPPPTEPVDLPDRELAKKEAPAEGAKVEDKAPDAKAH